MLSPRMIRVRLSLLLISLFTLLLIAAKQTDFTSLEEVLTWIVTGGGSGVLAGYVLAYFLENWAAWHNFPRWVKLLAPIALSGAFAFTAQSVLVLGGLAAVPPLLESILLMAINWLFSQRAYRGIKEGAYAESARPKFRS